MGDQRVLRIVSQIIKISIIGVLALVVVFGAVRFFDSTLNDGRSEAGIGDLVSITIKESDSADDVAAKLHKAGLIRYEWYFSLRVKLTGKTIQPGKYAITRGSSTVAIIDQISTGDPGPEPTDVPAAAQISLTVPEGWRAEQIAERLDEIGYLSGGESFLASTATVRNGDWAFLKGRKQTDSLEGFLFPDTYTFAADLPPDDLVSMMLGNFDQKFTAEFRAMAENMGMSVSDVLTFASLVEREAANDRERPVIADVYVSRWQIDMKLDADPAVRYGIGKRDGEWWSAPTADDLLNSETPYNLYRTKGLPPTPICNPGITSIFAVLQPAETDYLYFVALADGTGHLFAEDLESQSWNTSFVTGESSDSAPCANPWEEGCPLGGG